MTTAQIEVHVTMKMTLAEALELEKTLVGTEGPARAIWEGLNTQLHAAMDAIGNSL
jgi:hypothetical protein